MKRGSLAEYVENKKALIWISSIEFDDDIIGYLTPGDIVIILDKICNPQLSTYYHLVTKLGLGYVRTSYDFNLLSCVK